MWHSLQTAILGVFYIVAMGVGLNEMGRVINDIYQEPYDDGYDGLSSFPLIFAGSFLTCVFWVSTAHIWEQRVTYTVWQRWVELLFACLTLYHYLAWILLYFHLASVHSYISVRLAIRNQLPTLYISFICILHMYVYHRQWCRQCGRGMPLEWKLRKSWQKSDRYKLVCIPTCTLVHFAWVTHTYVCMNNLVTDIQKWSKQE